MKQVLIALDQLINTLFHGMADETLSARAFRNNHKTHWKIAEQIINSLFFWQRNEHGKMNHTQRAFAAELDRKQLPLEYR